jgi:plastocyanin
MSARFYCFAACFLVAICTPAYMRGQGVTVAGRVQLLDPASGGRSVDSSNAAVWLIPSAPSATGPGSRAARKHIRLIQEHKRFEPHLLVVPVGSVVDFPNFDPFFHNVFSLFEGKRFDLGLYESGTNHAVNFDRPGISFIFCNIHQEMSAVVVAVNTPYYGVSNRRGEVIIPNVPAGEYRLQVWHERCSPEALKGAVREVEVSQTEHSLGIIRLTQSGNLIARHKNKYGKDYIPPSPPNPLYE